MLTFAEIDPAGRRGLDAHSNGRIIAQSDALDGGVDRTPFVRAYSVEG